MRLDGLKIVIDCANGAAYRVAPKILWELGAEVIPINIDPDGTNVNKNSGSTFPSNLVAEVLKCNDNNDVRKLGIEWAKQQVKELIDFGAPCVHFYTMGKSDNVQKIVGSFS